jgi:hypothetical protein
MKRLIMILLALLMLVACDLPAPTTTPTGTPGADSSKTPTATLSPSPSATATVAYTDTPPPTGEPVLSANLFDNGDFEGGFYHQTYPELSIADGWFFWWDGSEGMGRPEAKPADATLYPQDVYSGRLAQQWFCFFRPCRAALAQGIDTEVGYEYQITARIKTWSSYQIRDDDGNVIDDDAESETETEDDRRASQWAIKVDLEGGIYPDEAAVVCPVEGWAHYDHWIEISCSFVATTDRTTIYFENTRLWGLRNQDSYLDDAFVGCYGCAAPTPWATPTPIATPGPTPTVSPPPATPVPMLDAHILLFPEGAYYLSPTNMVKRSNHSTNGGVMGQLDANTAAPAIGRFIGDNGDRWACIDSAAQVVQNPDYPDVLILECKYWVAMSIGSYVYGNVYDNN